MKILAVITVVLILVLAWTQNRTIQESNATNPPDQALVESGALGQGQQKPTNTASRVQGSNQSRNTANRAVATQANNAPSAYSSSRERQKQAQNTRTMASRNSTGGAANPEQYQAQSQQRADQQRADQQRMQQQRMERQRMAQSQRDSQQRASDRQRQSVDADHPASEPEYSRARSPSGNVDRPQDFAPGYDNIEHTPYRTASRSYLQTAGTRGPGDYNQQTHQQAINQPPREPTQGSQSTTYPGRQEAAEQPEANESKYQQVSEPVDCIYRDDKVYCR